jgi:polysaccharide export outer membrane protein
VPELTENINANGLLSLRQIKQKSEQALWDNRYTGTISIDEQRQVSFDFSAPIEAPSFDIQRSSVLEPSQTTDLFEQRGTTTKLSDSEIEAQPSYAKSNTIGGESEEPSFIEPQTRRKIKLGRASSASEQEPDKTSSLSGNKDNQPLSKKPLTPLTDSDVLRVDTMPQKTVSSQNLPSPDLNKIDLTDLPFSTNNERRAYHIKPGDRIEISVWGENMDRDLIVSPDGTVAYLLIGEVFVLNKTFKQVEEQITTRLSPFIIDPKVTVLGKSYEGNYVSILGAVSKPGRQIVNNNDRVLDVITRAEGLKFSELGDAQGEIANLKGAYLSRNGQQISIDFTSLLYEGDMSQNIPVRIGDFIYIPSAIGQHVYVTGEVNSPSAIPFRGRPTLLQAITQSGGINIQAHRRRIMLVRGSLDNPQITEFNFQKIMVGQSPNPFLNPGDIIHVPPTTLTKIERVSTQIIPFLNTITQGKTAKDSIKNW